MISYFFCHHFYISLLSGHYLTKFIFHPQYVTMGSIRNEHYRNTEYAINQAGQAFISSFISPYNRINTTGFTCHLISTVCRLYYKV